MSRNRSTDLLQAYPFWLFDVDPSLRVPGFVLGGPAYGFSSMTAPEITVEISDINQVNSMWKQHAIDGANVSPITMTRGVRFYDSSMYMWVKRAIEGEDITNRNLLMIQYMGFGGDGITLSEALSAGNSDVAGYIGPDGVEIIRIPGKAWFLWGCLPTRYKAGTDFDATSGDVSLAELDIQPNRVDEFSLDPFLLLDTAGF